MRVWFLVVLLAACGRVAFDDRAGAAPDAPPDAAAPCPAGYVPVAGNAALGTTDFCVMQFEARAERTADGQLVADGCMMTIPGTCAPDALDVATYRASATPGTALPWREVSATTAFAACAQLGAGYALLANAEWMTIARDAELVGANWSGGAPYTGRLVEGHSAGSNVIPVTDPGDPYTDTGASAADPPGTGWEQRRTLVLSSGHELWDLPSEIQEWIDWTRGGELDGAPPCTGGELPALACAGYANDDYNSASGTLDSSVGAGLVIGGSGNATRRGGQNTDHGAGYAGIYALNMNRDVTDTFAATGFRCVLRLP